MSSETKLNAEQICFSGAQRIRGFLYHDESCYLSKDASGLYFVFEFTMRDRDGVREIGRFSVLGALIEDGIVSEQSLHAALWQELGRLRGMV
jgi:hypothetical protein